MTRFPWEAIDARGRTVTGVEEASSVWAVEQALRSRGLHPLSVDSEAAPPPIRRAGFRRRGADVAEGVHHLASLLAAGFTLERALETVEELLVRDDVAGAVEDVRERVRAGSSLSDALAARTDVFPRLAIGMVRAGERSGEMAEALERLAEQLEREEELRSRVLSALLYPAFVAGVGGVAVVVLVGYVLPRFVDVLAETGTSLPATTALLLGLSEFVAGWWWLLLAGTVAAGAAFTAWARSPGGRRRIAQSLLRVPLVGALRQHLVAARFGRSLSTLLRSGLPILPALEAASQSMTDPVASEDVETVRERVKAGEGLAGALRDARAFPPLFLRMAALGEESGRLTEMLERAATVAEDQLDRSLDTLVRFVEPAMIVLFGGVVAFVALSLLQAIYGIRLQAF